MAPPKDRALPIVAEGRRLQQGGRELRGQDGILVGLASACPSASMTLTVAQASDTSSGSTVAVCGGDGFLSGGVRLVPRVDGAGSGTS